MRHIRGSRAYCGWLLVVCLCVVSALLGSACSSPNSSQNGVTVVTPAPVGSALSVFVEDRQSSQVVAFRARDGSTRWTYTPQGERFSGDGLTYSNGLVFGFTYGSDHRTLAAIDAANGHLRWHARVEGLLTLRMLVTNDYVVLVEAQQSSGQVRVIRTSDGAETYDIPLTSFSGSGFAADGDTAFACANDGTLAALGLADGQSLWRVTVAPGLADSVHPCGLKAGGGDRLCRGKYLHTQ
jgi:outer membrane protein assembly factor BamB